MDFETLLFLIVGGLYILFQVMGAKKKQQARQRPPVPHPSPGQGQSRVPSLPDGREPELADALREIRVALGMEAPPPPRLPVPREARSHAPELIDAAPEAPWAREFKERPKYYADADFEELATEGDRFGKTTTPPRRVIAATQTSAKSRRTVAPTPADMLKELQSDEAARKAFILGEILGPPRSRR